MNKELFSLTNPQRSILLTEEYYKGTNINNICGTAYITDEVNFDVLKKAMNVFVKNHDSFNMKLSLDGNEVKQYLDTTMDIDVEVVNIDTKEEISKLENDMLNHVFDIYNGDLFCMKIFRLPDNSGGFIVNVHHLYGDSWTLGIVANDILRIYSCLLNGEEITKNDEFSYIDYIYSERDYLSSDKFIKDKEYWNTIFSNVPEQATIPGSVSLGENDSFSSKASRSMFNIDKTQMEKINDFCKANHVSVFNFFMAVYSIYISRVSSQEDFVIGTPILNRTNFKEKNTTGMFINTAPLRVNVDANLNFKSFVEQIAKDSLGMLRHQKYYYQNILEDLRKDNPNLPNLYNVLISYQVTKANTEKGVNYNTRWSFNGHTGDDIDIHLFDLNDSGSLDVAYDYKLAKYTADDMTDMHNRILHIIWQILERNEICLKDIEIVTSKEKYDILYGFNSTALEYDENIPFIHFFEKYAELHPDDIAITFHEKDMDYRTLNEKANSLAFLLRENGITNNSIVGIMVDRSFEMIISILAVLKSGGVYIPIDPDYPNDRINYMIEDSRMQIILINKSCEKNINCSKILYVDLTEDFYNSNMNNITSISKPDDLSYIIYTSGSTGVPKGVMLTQKSLANFYHSMKDKIEYLSCQEQYRVMSITTVSFDIFAFESLMSLACGHHLYMSDNLEQKSTLKIEQLISKNKIQIIQSTPSVMRFHLDNLQDNNNFSSLKYVILAGEQLPIDLVNSIKSISPGCTIYNGYGPSETTIFSSVQNVTNISKINIGKPIANTQFYILDKNMNLLPKGHIGEIYIAGDGLGKGYLFKPELTSKNFFQNPFGSGLIYKTGDLGLWLNDGTVECKGRIDHQVKLRGLRIELEEIENKINSYNKTIRSAVVVRNDNGMNFLYAFIEGDEKIDLTNLRAFMKLSLPSYMIPNYFIILNELPKTPNGKIDRKHLKNCHVSVNKKEQKKILPKNKLEETIFNIISEIINGNEFSMDDDFLSIGMDSLSLIKFSTMVQNEFKVQVSIKDLYGFSSIIDCVKFIEIAKSKTKNCIVKVKKMDYYPLSSAQKRIYYATKMADENSLVYNIPGSLLVNAVLDKEKIVSSFNKLVKLHSSFRTCFKLVDGEPYQFILDEVNLNIEFFNDTESNIQSITDNFVKPFNLEEAPLLHIAVYCLDNSKTLVLLNSHHIIVDGASLNTIIKDFCNLYNGEELDSPELDYIDYSVWENNFINSEQIKPLEEFWLNKFKDIEIPNINLPYDFPVPVKQSFVGNKISSSIPDDLFLKLENIAKNMGTSSYMLFLSAFYVLLYKYTSQDDIIIGSPIAGRTSADLNDIIGMFVNNLSLYAHIDASNTFADFLQYIKGLVVDCIDNQAYPYDLLVKKLNLNGSNLFDIMFTYQNTDKPNIKIDGNDFTIIEANSNISKFNLSLEILPDIHKINLEYCTDLFKQETITRMLGHYINILNAIANNVNSKIADISMLSDAETNQILNEFNNTKIDYPSDRTIASLFEEQVEKTPNNIAVVFEDSSLTYRELNEKANQLAYKLYSKGIRNNDIIGVCLSRSLELIVSICAIFKLGATYMPMFVGYPEDRLIYMLENSKAKLLITNSKMNKLLDFNNIILDSVDDISYPIQEIVHDTFLPDSIAYIIYTSGSTGKPKGVKISNKNLVNFVYAFKKYYGSITDRDTFLASTNISFDVSIFELFLPLLSGSKLVLYTEDIIHNISLYCNSIIKNKITALYIPPNILNEVYSIIKNETICINKLLVGVEAIKKSTLNKFLQIIPNLKIVNGYGPTETTICCTAFPYHIDDSNDDVVSIGRPLYNNQIFILSKDKNLQPIGVLGEIFVAGDGVGCGYINDEEKTNTSYIDNIYTSSSKKMYKTGDIAKWNPDGTINLIGRNDSQVKISGHRIELKEINLTINSFPHIEKVFSTTYNLGNTVGIVSYFTADKEISTKDLTAFIKNKLADYMIPNFIMQINSFPLTPNGKIDKEKLPTSFIKLSNNYVAPRNKFESDVVTIWKNLFGINKISINDNFFDLGGDSLIAIKFQLEAMNIGLNITYSDIFSYPTIKQLAEKNNKSNNIIYKDDNYDYTKINELISKNQIENITSNINCNNDIGNILLIGSTGFLGAHILDNYLSNKTGKVYCLIRVKDTLSPEVRLKKVLNFYFGDKYNNLFGDRIVVVNGDITDKHFRLNSKDYQLLGDNVDIVINSAALVKHYGDYKIFNDTNVIGTSNIINFCETFNKKFYHISTLSVSGSGIYDNYSDNIISFSENNFYIGQNLNNVYIYTKFEAEKIIFEEIITGRLSACVLRIGNISNRFYDGKFQINVSENAFANRLKSILKLGVIQNKYLEHFVEFTPVDICSEAIIKIISSNNKFNIFHLINCNFVRVDTLLNYLKCLNITLSPVEDIDFSNKIDYYLSNDNLKTDITGIITDLDENRLLNLISSILPNSDFTQYYLQQLGFEWPKIDMEYIQKYINYFKDINFLD